MIVWIVIGAVLLVSVVLIAVEGRIMHKPESERSDRERRFMQVDRAVGRANQSYARNVAPWLVVGLAVVGLAITIPFWAEGKTGAAAGLTGFFLVFGVGAIVFWALVLRKRGRGSAWREDQDRQQREADAAGRPRWFVSVKAGWLLGGMFTAIGIAALVTSLIGGGGFITASILLAVGILFLVMVVIQQRAEAKR